LTLGQANKYSNAEIRQGQYKMKNNIIKLPMPEVYSPALQAVTDAVDKLSDEDTDKLFSYLWAMGYGETS
jgi:hypothetical protein